MTCPICKHGKTTAGLTTLIFQREKSTIIIKSVPADICDNCSESFISEDISKKILDIADREVKKGIEVEILNYAA